jgi:hypothetical protein
MSVASVSKPIGRRRIVAGSSFIAERKTRAAPARMPERTSGTVTRASVPSGPLPRLRAASSWRGLTASRDDSTPESPCGKKRTTYAKTRSASVW